ncbi:Threonine synthase [Candidatus Gugararchaeum adminiculabundum]|nr:Threonine synthase [Candidatus Gugararchaeum adminiculabundum]
MVTLSANKLYELKCIHCKASFTEDQTYCRCLKCGGALDVVYDYEQVSERLNQQTLRSAPISALKYLAFYPILNYKKIVSLDEGGTPLYSSKTLSDEFGFDLKIKNEGMNPTGAFKDRGSMVELTKAVENSAKVITVASTGNMAASVSAYSSKVNLPCYVFVPEGTALGKLAQTLSYGARVLQIKGTYSDASRITEVISKKYDYRLTGDYAFRVEGQKSTAFEIAEQLGWKFPDWVIVPIGCGTHLAGIWKGFKEFRDLGIVSGKLPHLVGVQADGCPPVVTAFNNPLKTAKITPIEKPDTIATAIAAGDPLDGDKALTALRESNGLALSVSDGDMLEAQQLIGKSDSIFAEPSAAASIAAIHKLKGKLTGTVVAILTGNGLKDPRAALSGLTYPPAVEPVEAEVSKFITQQLYNLRAPVRREEKDQLIFSTIPELKQLRETVVKLFNVKLGEDEIKDVLLEIGEFTKKGKRVTKSDLKLIIEAALSRIKQEKRILKVLDYSITDSAHEKPKAEVTVGYKGKKYDLESTGDGPVDAAINAIRKVLTDFDFSLTDYHVDINTGGTEATVDVSMTLQDKHKNKVYGKGTNPDIVVASIRAFENGYNTLYWKQNPKQ